jgi:IS30 family transposase
MSYSHLTIVEREEVRVMLEEGRSQRYIAQQLNRAPSTINRELKRNNVST